MILLSEIIKKSYTKPYAIHCDTKAKANLLFEKLKKLGVKWYVTNDNIIENTKIFTNILWNVNLWDVNKNDTCYILDNGKLSYSPITYNIQYNYVIVDFKDIADFVRPIFKQDIKLDRKFNNMLIVCKNKKYVLLKYDGNEYKVQCHEQDKFDWRIGFGLALSQIYGKKSKWKEHREYYRNNKKRKLDYKKYALWCINEFYHNDMFDINNLEYRIKEINENGKVDL